MTADRVAELEARVDALQRQLAELTEVQLAQAEALARAVEQMAGPRAHVPRGLRTVYTPGGPAGPRAHVPRPERHLRLVE